MSLFNETLLWFMKRRMPRIEAMYERPLELQEQMLQGLLSHGRSTEWGAKHVYQDIRNYERFKQQVPISTYEEIFPYIDRMMQGEQNILWDTPISWYSKSSGTTNARSKFIPVSKEALEECHMMGGKDMITLLIIGLTPSVTIACRVWDSMGSFRPASPATWPLFPATSISGTERRGNEDIAHDF